MSVSEVQPTPAPPDNVDHKPAQVSTQRSVVVWVLVVLSCMFVVLGTIAVGIQQLLLNTDRWVTVVGPLASDPAVQSSVADTAATLTVNALDLPGRVQSLPAPVQRLAAPIEASVGTFVDDQALRLVESPEFPELWVDLNRTGHQALVQLLRGEAPADGAVVVNNGEVQLNLVALVPALMQRLGQVAPDVLISALPAGLTDPSTPPSQLRQRLIQAVGNQLPPDFGYVSLTEASTLVTARQAVQLVDRLTWGLVLLALVLIAVSLIVSVERRLTTLRLGVGVALGMLLGGLWLLVTRDMLVSALAGHPITGAAEAALNAVLASLGQFMFVVFIVAAAVALLAYVAGRRDWATAIHR